MGASWASLSHLIDGCASPKNRAPTRCCSMTASSLEFDRFVTVRGTEFRLEGRSYHFVGANYWQAMNLASRGPGGDREQLVRELDDMKAHGITNLRIMAASEGPDREPLRIVPALLQAPGVYNADL